MKKSFFEKSYLITLLLFLILLNGGILTLAVYTYHSNTDAAKKVCRAEQFCIAEAFEQDCRNKSEEDIYLLQVSFGSFYGQKGIGLSFAANGKHCFSNIPSEYRLPEAGNLLIETYSGKRILMISETVCDGNYILSYAKDVSYLDEELRHLIVVFVLLSVGVSALLSVLLYFVQRKLYLPLKKLQNVTREAARGDFTSRADETGRDEFSDLARDFNRMTDTIREQMSQLKLAADQKQQMLDNLAHEMRTPLTTIHGYAEYAFGVQLSEEERMKALRAIMSETMRLKSISTVLLDSAFLRENEIECKPLSIGALLQRCVQRLDRIARERKCTLCYTGGNFALMGEETLLEELVSNLVENALKACSEGGLVELGVLETQEARGFFVRDTGVGMTKEQLLHITEPFYRTDKARSRQFGGTGLGLALCKRIAEAHGATLSFTSELQKGTTAYVMWASTEQTQA